METNPSIFFRSHGNHKGIEILNKGTNGRRTMAITIEKGDICRIGTVLTTIAIVDTIVSRLEFLLFD